MILFFLNYYLYKYKISLCKRIVMRMQELSIRVAHQLHRAIVLLLSPAGMIHTPGFDY
jgi:hypothetical protein